MASLRSSRPSPFAPSTGGNSRTVVLTLMLRKIELFFMLLLLSRHVSYKVGAQAGARPSAKTMWMWRETCVYPSRVRHASVQVRAKRRSDAEERILRA